MTIYNKTSLKTFFEQGDVPTGTDYANLIDSQVNIGETAVQTMAGPLSPTELITSRVSATNGHYTGTLLVDGVMSAQDIRVDRIKASAGTFTNKVSAGRAAFQNKVSAHGGLVVQDNDVSADTVTIYASAVRSTNGIFHGVGIVSAAGSAQATAALLTNVINRGAGVVDGQTTGFAIPSNKTGLVQYLFNSGGSANLWPPVGGNINSLATNAAFPLAASAMVTIVHVAASAMIVK